MAALIFIVKSLLGLVVWAFLLRVLLPLCRADARNPFSQAIIRFTNPLVMPLRRVLPAWGRIDTGALVALLLVQLIATGVVWLMQGLPLFPAAILATAGRDLIIALLQLYFIVILGYVILSWVAPGTYSPGTNLLASLSNPVLRPFQRLIPPIAGIDFSAVFALIAIQALQILLRV